MKRDLLELLRDREIIHPTRIAAVEASHQTLRLTIEGHPWWNQADALQDGRLVLSFEGVNGSLDAQTFLDFEDDEALDFFKVAPLDEQAWVGGGRSFSVYCSSAISEPLVLYSLIEDYLWEAAAPRCARDYLNMPGGSLHHFCALTKSDSFLVGRFPEHMRLIVCAELSRQRVAHNVLTDELPRPRGLFVQLGDMNFTCERAFAEF